MSVNLSTTSSVTPSPDDQTRSPRDAGVIFATYSVGCDSFEVEKIAREIAYEQTVEVSPDLVTSRVILDEIVGRIDSIEPEAGDRGRFLVRIAYNAHLAGGQLPQLLNLIYGNISMKSRIRLLDLQLPDELLAAFPGPRFGLENLRKQLGVHGRPLLATALKPRGSTPQELARMAHRFAAGGGDIVKDDHNLIDSSLSEFRDRVTLIQREVDRANDSSGRACFYLPNLILREEELDPACEILLQAGIRGALVAPMAIGLERTRSLSARYPLFLMAHPTLTGAYFHDPDHGIAPGVFLGTLFRMIGADASIFPNFGGRFTFTGEDCDEICNALRSPLGSLKSGIPTPAGGMSLDNLPAMAEQFGEDSIYLIGSALISHSRDLQTGTREFLRRIEEYFQSRSTPPQPAFTSACEFPRPASRRFDQQSRRLAFLPDFSWDGRTAVRYKADDQLPFRDVTRHELIGRNGEKTSFDLRYFEIAPGGFSSLEKHLHTHTIIGVRGNGVLRITKANGDPETLPILPHDVAYVAPLAVHQLHNQGSEPFGFFCVVDHDRDVPQSP